MCEPHQTADNYPTGPAGSSKNSLHLSIGGLLPPRPLPPCCSRCQDLWQTSPTWSPCAQPPPAHLLLISSWWGRHCSHSWGSKRAVSTHGVRARQPWRTGHYLLSWRGSLAQAWRGRCVSSQYPRAATSGECCVAQPRLSWWSTRAAARRHKTVSEPLGGFGHGPWHLPGAPAPSRPLQGESGGGVT